MKLKIFYISFLTFNFLYLTHLKADIGKTGASFLLEDVSARTVGMGSAFCAVSDDAGLISVNPAGLNYIINPELTTMYRKGLIDSYYGFAGFVYPVLPKATLSLGALVFDGGDIDINYLDGTSRTVKLAQDMAISLGLGSNIGEYVFLGGNAKIIKSKLGEQYSANSVSGDFGIIVRTVNDKFSLGISAQNIGNGLKYQDIADQLPLILRTGIGYKLLGLNNHTLLIAGDVLFPKEDSMKTHLGIEYWYHSLIALRTGYKIGYEPDIITAGIGIKAFQGQIDYCYISVLDELTHKISFTVRFGSQKPYSKGEKYYSKNMPKRAIYYWSQVDIKDANHKIAREDVEKTKKLLEERKNEEITMQKDKKQKDMINNNILEIEKIMSLAISKEINVSESKKMLEDVKNYYKKEKYEYTINSLVTIKQKLQIQLADEENKRNEIKKQKETIENNILEIEKMIEKAINKGINTLVAKKVLEDAKNDYKNKKYDSANNNLTIAKQKLQIQLENMEKLIKKEKNIAVINFRLRNVFASEMLVVTDYIRGELKNTHGYYVIEADKVDKVISEMSLQQVDITSSKYAVQIGKVLMVKRIIVGTISKIIDSYLIIANLIDVETGNILKSENIRANSDKELNNACKTLAKKLIE
ncbi:MAG: hypothetical protein A2539_08545 [Elusimicrobia bacterium RIFOXYD2_FULL_34_15]|nr:MAG: hypothetical protein A2539_08545 [Elusimicrobia bacterium RIFOXYD2_FULL_34_15]